MASPYRRHSDAISSSATRAPPGRRPAPAAPGRSGQNGRDAAQRTRGQRAEGQSLVELWQMADQVTDSASTGAGGDSYDPKTDPKRKAKSNDPGWKYGFWPIIGNRDTVQCCLCDRKIDGGITRLKKHFVGGYGDVMKCSKTTAAIAREMQEAMNKKKRPMSLDDEEEDQGEDNDVIDLTEEFQAGSNPRSVTHLSSGTAAKRKQSALKFSASRKEPKTKSIGSMVRRTPKEVVEQRHAKGPSQVSIQESMRTKEERDAVNLEWARFFYECGIPFNAANSRQFEIAIEATAQYGSGYKPPRFHELREPLLEKVVKETDDLRQKHEVACKQYGCTLMSDGWTDRRGHHLINFLVNSPEGTFSLESIDASNEVHDQVMLADLLEKRITDIGKDKVVQVVTDNGANYKAAGRLLMERFPTLYWTPCAAHCLDLMLEEVEKLKEFTKPISRARHVTTFIYRHGRLLSAMREKTGGRDLVRPVATRFATTFLTLQSLHKHKDALRYLFTTDDWTSCKLAKTEAGKKVYDIVLSREFWNSVEDCLRASLPLIIVLRVVDGDERPAMPEVAALMTHAKEKIKAGFCTENKKRLLNKIIEIIERRWDKQMDTPLYGAALFLNPGKFFVIQKEDDEYVGYLRGCFNDVLARMIEDESLRDNLDHQSMLYEDQRGDIFKNVMALQSIKTKNPLDWWRTYGGRFIELQRFAKRIVSLCASSSGCERNWSTFEFIHTKKRNRLEHKRLNDLVYISYNRKMTSRFQKRREEGGKSYDPLVIEEFDWDNEWVDPMAKPQGELEPTWEQIDEAIGASRELRGRNLPRTYSRRASLTPRVVEEEEPQLGEDEEDIILDDEDVVDDYGEPQMDACEGDGDNMIASNDLDEFALDDF